MKNKGKACSSYCQGKEQGWKPGLPESWKGYEKNSKLKKSVFTF